MNVGDFTTKTTAIMTSKHVLNIPLNLRMNCCDANEKKRSLWNSMGYEFRWLRLTEKFYKTEHFLELVRIWYNLCTNCCWSTLQSKRSAFRLQCGSVTIPAQINFPWFPGTWCDIRRIELLVEEKDDGAKDNSRKPVVIIRPFKNGGNGQYFEIEIGGNIHGHLRKSTKSKRQKWTVWYWSALVGLTMNLHYYRYIKKFIVKK